MARKHIDEFKCDLCGQKETDAAKVNGWIVVDTLVTRPTPQFLADKGVPPGAVDEAHVGDRMPFEIGGDFCSTDCAMEFLSRKKLEAANAPPDDEEGAPAAGQYL